MLSRAPVLAVLAAELEDAAAEWLSSAPWPCYPQLRKKKRLRSCVSVVARVLSFFFGGGGGVNSLHEFEALTIQLENCTD